MRQHANAGLFFAAAVLAVAITSAPDAQSAVRTCGPRLQSDVVFAHTQQDAKKLALDQWRSRAAKFAEGYGGWHVAAGKVLKCFPKGAGFECIAVGFPCVIQQNPNQKPAGQDRKGQPL